MMSEIDWRSIRINCSCCCSAEILKMCITIIWWCYVLSKRKKKFESRIGAKILNLQNKILHQKTVILFIKWLLTNLDRCETIPRNYVISKNVYWHFIFENDKPWIFIIIRLITFFKFIIGVFELLSYFVYNW